MFRMLALNLMGERCYTGHLGHMIFPGRLCILVSVAKAYVSLFIQHYRALDCSRKVGRTTSDISVLTLIVEVSTTESS